jgi:hypothetical protein
MKGNKMLKRNKKPINIEVKRIKREIFKLSGGEFFVQLILGISLLSKEEKEKTLKGL